jgi:hypothetical protein
LRVLVCSDRRSLHRCSLHRSLHHRSLHQSTIGCSSNCHGNCQSLQLCRSLHRRTFTLNARAVPPLALLLHYYRSLYHSSSRLLSSPLDPLLLLVGRSTIARSIRSLALSVRSLQRRSLVRSQCRPLAMPVLARDAARLQCRFSLYRRSLYTAFARLLAHGD